MNEQKAYQNTHIIAIKQIEAVKELDTKLVKDGKKLEFGSYYRTRARTMASMVYEIGLLSTLSYLYTKATKDTYDRVVKATKPGTNTIDPQLLKDEQQNYPSIEEIAHAVYLNHILTYISSQLARDGQEKDPLGLLKTLAENPIELRVAEALLKPYLMELKHLAEAVLEEKERET